jgi:hypothetical protein
MGAVRTFFCLSSEKPHARATGKSRIVQQSLATRTTSASVINRYGRTKTRRDAEEREEIERIAQRSARVSDFGFNTRRMGFRFSGPARELEKGRKEEVC